MQVSTHVIHAWSNRRVPDGRQLAAVEIISDSRLRWNPNTVRQNVHSRFQALQRRRIPLYLESTMNIFIRILTLNVQIWLYDVTENPISLYKCK